jgi:hypothetical protein
VAYRRKWLEKGDFDNVIAEAANDTVALSPNWAHHRREREPLLAAIEKLRDEFNFDTPAKWLTRVLVDLEPTQEMRRPVGLRVREVLRECNSADFDQVSKHNPRSFYKPLTRRSRRNKSKSSEPAVTLLANSATSAL